MKRTVAVLVGTVVLLATVTATAEAKGGEGVHGRAVISGPGLAHPIVLTGAALTKMLELIGPEVGGPLYLGTAYRYNVPAAPPGRDRGPRFSLTYQLTLRVYPGPRESVLIHQVLYPYLNYLVPGQSWPWVFTPPGQTIEVGGRRHVVEAGWWHSAALYAFLVQHGLPKAAPVTSTGLPQGPGPFSGPARIEVGLGALALLLVLAALAARPGKAPRATARIG